MQYFSRGKRGKIYLEKDYAVKKSNPIRVKNEVKWLKILNKYKIGPRLVKYNQNSFKYNFIKGDFIIQFILKSNKKLIKKILIDVLNQCRTLDKLKVNKKEMHHPIKHIIIKNKKAYMIDFERCYKTNKPKNVTQFCQFILNYIKNILKEKGFKIDKKVLNALIRYKHNQDEKNFNEILKIIR